MNELRNIPPFIIQDLDTLKVVADPLRNQIIEMLIYNPLTVKQVAERLGLGQSKLYYHFNMLEKHGLIHVVETRVVSNMIEKVYRAVAGRIDVDPNLLSFSTQEGQENVYSMIASNIDATREDLLRSLQARALTLEQGSPPLPRKVIISRLLSRVTEEQAREFHQRFVALMEEFAHADQEDADLQTYALTVAYYPSFYYDEAALPGKESQ